jgi:hypothetical protein
MQEVVRSVLAKKFANLKSLQDFMSRQRHQSRQSNYPNRKKGLWCVVCLSYLSRAHVKNVSCFSAFSKLNGRTACLFLTPLLCCKQDMIYGSPCLSICHIRPHLSWFFFKPACSLLCSADHPLVGGFVVLKHDLNYKASNPPTKGHSKPDPPVHHEGWIVCDEETVFCWAPVP